MPVSLSSSHSFRPISSTGRSIFWERVGDTAVVSSFVRTARDYVAFKLKALSNKQRAV